MQQESTTHLDTAVELSSSSGQQSMKWTERGAASRDQRYRGRSGPLPWGGARGEHRRRLRWFESTAPAVGRDSQDISDLLAAHQRSARLRTSHVPSDADSLIAYPLQLATSAAVPWISTNSLRSSASRGRHSPAFFRTPDCHAGSGPAPSEALFRSISAPLWAQVSCLRTPSRRAG